MRPRIAEIHEDAVAQVLGDEALEACHGIGDAVAVRADHVAHVLRIEARRKTRRADKIAEHHCQLTALGAKRGRI